MCLYQLSQHSSLVDTTRGPIISCAMIAIACVRLTFTRTCLVSFSHSPETPELLNAAATRVAMAFWPDARKVLQLLPISLHARVRVLFTDREREREVAGSVRIVWLTGALAQSAVALRVDVVIVVLRR